MRSTGSVAGVEAAILDRAMELAEAQVRAGHAVLMLSGADWHPGVVGIVAGRVKERFNRPGLVGARLADGTVKGSGRSVPGLDLGAAVIAARQRGLLLTGGGHAMAAGFSLLQEQLERFHAFLDERLSEARARPSVLDLAVDGVLNAAGANAELAAHVGRLAPFGAGNEEPVFVLANVRVARADRIGKEANTLRVLIEGEGGAGPRLKGLAVPRRREPAGAPRSRPATAHACTWRASSAPSCGTGRPALPSSSPTRPRLDPAGSLRYPAPARMSCSSSGLGHRPFTAVTRVRTPYGTPALRPFGMQPGA